MTIGCGRRGTRLNEVGRLFFALPAAVVIAVLSGACVDPGTDPLDPNRPPALIEPLPVHEGFERFTSTIDLHAHIRDPEREPLTFEVVSSDPGVVQASVSGSMIALTGIGRGTATLGVTATDPAGLSVSTTWTVIVFRPVSVCERTPEVRDAILVGTGAGECERIPEPHMGRIRSLTLELPGIKSGIPRLRAGDFAGLSELASLNLAGNDLASLPEGIFSGLSGLEVLTLGGNRLSSLPEGVFSELAGLQELDLGSNLLTSLPDGVFSGLSSLQVLNLNRSRLASLPDGVFSGLHELQTLDLSGNLLTSVPEGAYAGLAALSELRLQDNRFTSLKPGWFSGLSSLTTLGLGGNRLTSLPAGVFADLPSLWKLDLDRNRLQSLPDGAFSGAPNLSWLGLGHNEFESVQASWFSGLTDLFALLLSHNRLNTLPDGVFDELKHIRILELSSNRLATLPEGVFSSTDSLRSIGLDDNHLTVLPDDVFSGLSSLASVELRANRLTSLPEGTFAGVRSLGAVRTGGNPGAPFELALEFEELGDAASNRVSVRVSLPQGAPFTMAVPLTVRNGSVEPAFSILPAGATVGTVVRVTRTSSGQPVQIGVDLVPEVGPRFSDDLIVVAPEPFVLFGS